MASLPDFDQNQQKYILPTTQTNSGDDQAYVVLRVGKMLAGDIAGITDPDYRLLASIEMLTSRIVEWNFKDASGTPVPITVANVRRLEIDDLTFLLEKLNVDDEHPSELADPEKKAASSDISTQ